MKTVSSFAKLFLNPNVKVIEKSVFSYLRFFSPKSTISELKSTDFLEKSEWPFLDGVKLSLELREKLYLSFFELRFAMSATKLAEQHFRKNNKEIVRKRRDTIKHLKKALEYGRLSKRCQSTIEAEIERLAKYDEQPMIYHPIKDLDFVMTIWTTDKWQKELEGIWNARKEQDLKTPREEELEFLIAKNSNIIDMMEATPIIHIKGGRPSKFFLKVLQVVIYRLLNEEGKIPREKSKVLAAELINKFLFLRPDSLTECGGFKMAAIKPKDIDNALHSS